MIIKTLATRYRTWRRIRAWSRANLVLCGYLGCGEYATRRAYDRLMNPTHACPDTAHGRTVVS